MDTSNLHRLLGGNWIIYTVITINAKHFQLLLCLFGFCSRMIAVLNTVHYFTLSSVLFWTIELYIQNFVKGWYDLVFMYMIFCSSTTFLTKWVVFLCHFKQNVDLAMYLLYLWLSFFVLEHFPYFFFSISAFEFEFFIKNKTYIF